MISLYINTQKARDDNEAHCTCKDTLHLVEQHGFALVWLTNIDHLWRQ